MNLTDPKIRSMIMREMGRAGGRKGGVVRAERLTPAQRKEVATQAANVRWGRWTTTAPKLPGKYWFRSGETDGQHELLDVDLVNGRLVVRCPYVGDTLMDVYHHNLIHPEWKPYTP